MSTANDIRTTFFQECDELLEALEDGLGEIDESIAGDAVDVETVNAVFRSVHSIKGGAAAFGLDDLVEFAHQFETVLDAMRAGGLQPDDEVMKLCHRAADHLNDLVIAGRDNEKPDIASGADLAARLSALVAGSDGTDTNGLTDAAQSPAQSSLSEDFGFMPLGISLDLPPAEPPDRPDRFTIRFTPSAALYSSGNDPALLFRELAELGGLTSIADTSRLPSFDSLKLDDSHLGWTLHLDTYENEQSVREVFEFVEGLCELEILRSPVEESGRTTHEGAQAGTAPKEDQSGAGEAVEGGPDKESPRQGRPDAGTAVLRGQPKVVSAEDSSASQGPAADETGGGNAGQSRADAPKATVRVNLDLVDRLINMVGELVINQAVLTQCVDDAGLHDRGDLATSLNEFRNLARDIQESVMAIRAQSVKPLFQRMARIVREASDLSGKQVRFVTEGETTEVDKTIIERLVDPLTHMIRNAVDHGLERPEDRTAAGKPETGQVTLSAAHRSGRVLIEVSDDGAGINRQRVFQIAVEKGLIANDAVLKEAEIDNLLFLPGFSTAKEVSNLSGRGVGMDVVRSAIQKLGGRVSIQSRPGRGTTMSISLPLTLAVLDGMVVDVAGQTMVVPISTIVETLRPRQGEVHPLGSDNLVVSVRNRLVPIIDLGVVFGHRRLAAPVSDMVLLLVEADDESSWALAVDQIFDQRQVVIKGLESNYGHVPGVAAATILGDGNIALIIDPEETARRSAPVIDPGELSKMEEV